MKGEIKLSGSPVFGQASTSDKLSGKQSRKLVESAIKECKEKVEMESKSEILPNHNVKHLLKLRKYKMGMSPIRRIRELQSELEHSPAIIHYLEVHTSLEDVSHERESLNSSPSSFQMLESHARPMTPEELRNHPDAFAPKKVEKKSIDNHIIPNYPKFQKHSITDESVKSLAVRSQTSNQIHGLYLRSPTPQSAHKPIPETRAPLYAPQHYRQAVEHPRKYDPAMIVEKETPKTTTTTEEVKLFSSQRFRDQGNEENTREPTEKEKRIDKLRQQRALEREVPWEGSVGLPATAYLKLQEQELQARAATASFKSQSTLLSGESTIRSSSAFRTKDAREMPSYSSHGSRPIK